jgi:Glycosyl hydrolases family 16
MKAANWIRHWAVWALGVAWLGGSLISAADAQLLLRDDFDGTGNVDTTVWRLPFGDSEGTFVGRTQFRGDSATDLPQQGIAEASAEDGKVMEVNLDTYSPIDPGNQFLGTDVLTKRNFGRAGGISYEARMRLKPTTTAGLVGSGFLYNVTRESPPGTTVRDEIDLEMLGNQATGAMTQDPFTNVWNDGNFASPGNGGYVDISGFDLTQFHNYRVDWTPQSVKWYVDNQLVRTVTSGVPDDPMNLHFNLWAPDSSFADAFSSALQPAATPGANATYTLQVDHVEVNRTNTTTSANLLTDGSFETATLTDINAVPTTTTGQWLRFGNSGAGLDDPGMVDPMVPDMAQDGIVMVKMFGPYTGHSDASGVLQNVPASPGQEFEASAWVQTPAGDSIQGNRNFNTVQISFLDSAGVSIDDALYVPTNGQTFPMLDGRDPNMENDTWYQGVTDAIAPPGTAYARISLFFIQIAGEEPLDYGDPGASWFDNASLVLLTPDTVAGLAGDYNGNGVIDAADYTTWRDAMTAGATSLLNDPTPGSVTEADFTYWRDHFGETAGAGSGAGVAASAVPEPNTFVMLVLGLLISLIGNKDPQRRT